MILSKHVNQYKVKLNIQFGYGYSYESTLFLHAIKVGMKILEFELHAMELVKPAQMLILEIPVKDSCIWI